MEYLSKEVTLKNRREFREIFDLLIKNLKTDCEGNQFKWSLYYTLVGSTKRNLVLKKKNEAYDLDYQIYLRKYPQNCSPKKLKDKIRLALDEIVLEYDLKECEDSKNVLTIKKFEGNKIIYSYDIAIMMIAKNGDHLILKNDKVKNDVSDYHFLQVKKSSKYYEDYRRIKKSKKWTTLRSIYKDKKEEDHKKEKIDRKKSFSILIEAIKETLESN